MHRGFHGEPKIVISTSPDGILQGTTTNMRILKVAMSVWPKAHIIATLLGFVRCIELRPKDPLFRT